MKEQPLAVPGRRHGNTSARRGEADVLVVGEEFDSLRREEEPTTPMGIAIRSWKASTTAGYPTHLRGLADVEDEMGEEGWLPKILSRQLARHVQHRGSASAARGIISAVRACEDLQWITGVVQPIHWRLAKAGAQSVKEYANGAQEYANPVMLRHLVEAAKSADDRAVVAMALVSYVCFLRVAEAASVRAGDVRDSCYVAFWNSKTGDEGWQRRPVPEWLRPYVQWLLEWAEDRGLARDDILFPAGAAQLERSLAALVSGTTWTHHRWHCFRRGGAAACWKRSLEPPHFIWWGRWAATATAMAYALGYGDEDVVAPLCLPQVWSAERRSLFVEPQKVWGDIMYEGQRRDKNKPVSGRGELRRAAPSLFKGKGYADEPRSDAADLGSPSDDSDCGVSADEGVVQRPGVRQPPGVVQTAAGKRGSGRGGDAGTRTVGDGAQRGADPDPRRVNAGRQAEQSGAGSSKPPTRDGAEFKFTAPPSANLSPGPGKSGIHGVLHTLLKVSQGPGRDRWLAEPYQCHQGGRVARRWKWRKVLSGEPVPEGWRDLNGETGRAMANPDPNRSDPGLYPVAPSSDSGVRAVLGDEGAGSEMKVSGVMEGVVGLGPGLHYKGGVFVTIMADLTRHFVWMAIKLACAEALLVHRLWIFWLRLTSVCGDFRLDEPMAVCLMAVRCLLPEAWETLNHLSTSPRP